MITADYLHSVLPIEIDNRVLDAVAHALYEDFRIEVSSDQIMAAVQKCIDGSVDLHSGMRARITGMILCDDEIDAETLISLRDVILDYQAY